MPLSFILLGLLMLFSLFYITNKVIKILITIVSLVLMLGFFYGNIEINEYSINIIFIIVPFIIALITLFIASNKINILIVSLSCALVYVFIAKINSDFISILNPIPVTISIFILGLILLNKPIALISYYCISFLFISICNIIFEQPLGNVMVGEINLFNLCFIMLFTSILISFLTKKIKVLKRKNI